MMQLDEFFEHALVVGKGRKKNGRRNIPAFVPSGDGQDWLFDNILPVFAAKDFRLFDVRGPDGYRKALNSFALSWPLHSGATQRAADLYPADVPDAETRLLIVCGSERMPRFWTHLQKSSALHIGAIFPPFIEPQDKCIIVPDAAIVCVLVKERDVSNIPDGCLEPVLQYTTHKAQWLG